MQISWGRSLQTDFVPCFFKAQVQQSWLSCFYVHKVTKEFSFGSWFEILHGHSKTRYSSTCMYRLLRGFKQLFPLGLFWFFCSYNLLINSGWISEANREEKNINIYLHIHQKISLFVQILIENIQGHKLHKLNKTDKKKPHSCLLK